MGFFNAAKPLLSSPSNPARIPHSSDERTSDCADYTDDDVDFSTINHGAVNGQILVTLFEGEPYTLWNIRDLARHCGLRLVESFRFPWSAYPGYQHARTIGDITTGKDRSAEGKRKGAWRGEEREARCYVFEDSNTLCDTAGAEGHATGKRKRSAEDSNDDSD